MRRRTARPEPAAAAGPWPGRRGRRDGLRLVAAVLLHALLLWTLWAALDRVEIRRPAREAWVALTGIAVGPKAEPPATARPAPAVRPPALAARDRPAARATRGHGPLPATVPTHDAEVQAITLPPAQTPAASAALAAAQPASGASAPLVLDAAATRAAIRAIARGPLLSERAAGATGLAAAAGANERLARNVEAARTGDCLKGDYPGGGGGLLSLPFLAVAAATGQCAK